MAVATKTTDEKMMERALELAARGLGFTAPNPVVGCVIARGREVVGEGWHRGRGWHPVEGRAHAEVEALRVAGDKARGASAFVTLEPCNHHGSTPPCVRALIEAGIARVVYAMADPNPTASGGAAALRAAAITTLEFSPNHPLADQARALNRAWLHALDQQRPYVIAKYGASLDGRIATRTGDSQWITGELARRRAHDLRQMADAILVGAGTILSDNPSLTVRNNLYPAHPLRVILDSHARTSPMAKVYQPDMPGCALLVTSAQASAERLAAFERQGTEILICPTDEAGRICLNALMAQLYARGVLTVMVEGGASVLGSFFDRGLIDEVWAFIAPMLIGGGANAFAGQGAASLGDALRLDDIAQERLGPDILIRGRVARAAQKQEAGSCSLAS